MTAEKEIRYAHRTCPCLSNDVEGIQTWLEDMAAEGLLLEGDGAFMGIYTFRRTQPQKVLYRMVPVKQKKGFFSETGDGPEAEEQEFSEQCGWEYMMRCGSFHVYRTLDPKARPLHTDAAVHAMALESVKRQHYSALAFEIIYFAILFVLRRYSIACLFLSGALIGPLYVAAVLGLVVWAVVRLTADWLRLSRYQKRLRSGDSLDSRKDWKRHAWPVRIWKSVPTVLILTLLVTWGISAQRAGSGVPLEDYAGDTPFATLQDVFPGCEADHSSGFGDYNTAVHYKTAVADNYEWDELAYITVDGTRRYCLLRLKYHELGAEWLAKGLANDYYRQEAWRYNGKRFEDLSASETALDSVRVFSSYGILHVLVQHGNCVAHAVVNIEGDDQANQWHLWLEAAERMLLEK